MEGKSVRCAKVVRVLHGVVTVCATPADKTGCPAEGEKHPATPLNREAAEPGVFFYAGRVRLSKSASRWRRYRPGSRRKR